MSGLQNFLTPYSHLVFANRNTVIVLLAVVLGWTVIQLLVARWRTERLERDLLAARSSLSTSPARSRHASAPVAEEAQAESGALPPIKGGRSYARNLGSALQKAGIPAAGPQLYSPPVPQGWSPNTGNAQPNPMPAPMQPPTYAPAPAPWGAPPAQPAPWAYPAGANRPPFPAPPMGPMPAPYAPPPAAPFSANQPQPLPPGYAPSGPGPFPQPFPSAGAGPDQNRAVSDASGLNAAPPAPPLQAPVPAPSSVAPPVGEAPTEDSESKDSRRRGKPKRRRFSLSVLDNLEKMVQPKPAEPPAPSNPAPVVVPTTPVVETAPPFVAATTEPTVETPTLFEQPAAETQADPVDEAAQPEMADLAPIETAAEPPVEPEPAVVAEAPVPARRDMRSMLFGEEPVAEPQPTTTEVTETAAAPSWQTSEPASPWAQAEPVAEQAPEADAVAAQAEPEPEPGLEPEPEAEQHTQAFVESPVETPMEPEVEMEAPQAEETAPVEAVEPAPTEPPAEAGGEKTGAGVLVIIEDDKAAADYYATLFRGNGYQVDVANDGVSGVDLCVRVQPQVILLDVMMPRQNGILVLQTLRASDETKNTPVVVMSNFSEPTLIKRALQLGALEYVIKTQVEGPALLSALPHWMNREKAFAA